MEVYGLTGGIGSGKSTVAHLLEDYGIPVVSADELSRMVVAPGSRGLADVVEAFGSEVLDEKGELDRKKMGQIVFTTPERRRQLEAILHPRIRERYEQVLDALEKAGHPVMVYEVPLLFEKKLDEQDEMKAVILVTATADTRIARVKERDSLTTDDVLSRMRAQMPEQEKRERADYVIHNDGDLDDLRREVEYLLSRFLRIPPRTDAPLLADLVDEVVEEIDAELELEESEIDTLSPQPEAAAESRPMEVATASAEVPVSPVMPVMPVMAPAASIPSPAPQAAPQLEVELQPIAKPAASSEASAGRSGASWIPAGSKPVAPVAAPAAPPTVAPSPIVGSTIAAPPPVAPAPAVGTPATTPSADAQARPPRQRSSTVPQLSVPETLSGPSLDNPDRGAEEEP
jgi:dephospho-CoA kinase